MKQINSVIVILIFFFISLSSAQMLYVADNTPITCNYVQQTVTSFHIPTNVCEYVPNYARKYICSANKTIVFERRWNNQFYCNTSNYVETVVQISNGGNFKCNSTQCHNYILTNVYTSCASTVLSRRDAIFTDICVWAGDNNIGVLFTCSPPSQVKRFNDPTCLSNELSSDNTNACRDGQTWDIKSYNCLTNNPTINPTVNPTVNNSISPSINPTIQPTINPSFHPSINPVIKPSINPTIHPTVNPTVNNSINPSVNPTINPIINPSIQPTFQPTDNAITTIKPTMNPTKIPNINATLDDGNDSNDVKHILIVYIIIALIGLLYYY